jgi:lipopolysaccharide/colanic/teichoic acid biosynthesis glycosyltransferase
MLKHVVEVTFSLFLLILLAPLLGLTALVIRLDSRGPAIFRQERVGRYGKPFILYKFRTMYSDSDPQAISPEVLQDKRITRVGRFLRKYAVDEWPQFFNILKRDMSFVGPRPQLGKELEEFQGSTPDLLKKRLLVRPGLTSSWAVTRGTVKNKPTLKMLEEDCRYVDTASPRTDAGILFRTFTYLLSRR